MDADGWPSDWLRGTLSLLVLATLSDGPTYGYAVAARLQDGGVGTVKGGTLYPLLARLEKDGFINSHWEPGEGGPGRKFFELTPSGRDHLAASARRWDDFSAIVRGVLAAGVAHPSGQGTNTTREDNS